MAANTSPMAWEMTRRALNVTETDLSPCQCPAPPHTSVCAGQPHASPSPSSLILL